MSVPPPIPPSYSVLSTQSSEQSFILSDSNGQSIKFKVLDELQEHESLTTLAERTCEIYTLHAQSLPESKRELGVIIDEINSRFEITPITSPSSVKKARSTASEEKRLQMLTAALARNGLSATKETSTTPPPSPIAPPFPGQCKKALPPPPLLLLKDTPPIQTSPHTPFPAELLSEKGKTLDLNQLPEIFALFNISAAQLAKTIKYYNIDATTGITNARGVIQDPAGSAIGSSSLIAGGLSGALYKKFTGRLHPIPMIAPGVSIFNSHPAGSQLLHTHSHQLMNKPIEEVVQLLTETYLGALRAFTAQASVHKQDTINLCAVSASIYGGSYALRKFSPPHGHIDPLLSILTSCVALSKALEIEEEKFEGKKVVLHFLGSTLAVRAQAVLSQLLAFAKA